MNMLSGVVGSTDSLTTPESDVDRLKVFDRPDDLYGHDTYRRLVQAKRKVLRSA